MDDFAEIAKVARITLQPGQVFVLNVDEHLSRDASENMQHLWAHAWRKEPRTPALIVLGKGMRLEVAEIHKTPIEEAADALFERFRRVAESGGSLTIQANPDGSFTTYER